MAANRGTLRSESELGVLERLLSADHQRLRWLIDRPDISEDVRRALREEERRLSERRRQVLEEVERTPGRRASAR